MSRKFTMTPIEPRTAGSLKGFGFTVTWGDDTEYPRGESGTAREASGGKRTEQSEMRSLQHGTESAPPPLPPAHKPDNSANSNFATVPHLGPVE